MSPGRWMNSGSVTTVMFLKEAMTEHLAPVKRVKSKLLTAKVPLLPAKLQHSGTYANSYAPNIFTAK